MDKIYKKLVSSHVGELGSYRVYWGTENVNIEDNFFDIDLGNYPKRWESFFPSTAFGRSVNLRFYKNDANDFKIKEVYGIYTPEPIIV